MNYKETLDVLYNMLPDFQNVGSDAYKPGLARAIEFNRILGDPDKSFCSVHIAGTNGKGSVSHMLASVLNAAGYCVGLYTSPHMRDFRERIKVDGEMIPEEEVVGFTKKHLDEMQRLGMSFFEATMCMAFDYFEKKEVEIAVVEAGLGGRLDSTNILHPLVSVITNIGMDHQSFLGDTIEKIAAEKAGIIKKETPVVIGEKDRRSFPIFEEVAARQKSNLVCADELYSCVGALKKRNSQEFTIEHKPCGTQFHIETDLMGDYQCRNIVTAMAVLHVLNNDTQLSISNRTLKSGLANAALSTGLRGRWEILGHDPLVVCDTGHNEHGLRLVVEQIRGEKYKKLYIVLGMVDDKDFSAILPLFPKDAYYIFAQPSNRRALPAEELSSKAEQFGLEGEIVPKVGDAYARAREMASPEDMIFIGGSTYTVTEIIG